MYSDMRQYVVSRPSHVDLIFRASVCASNAPRVVIGLTAAAAAAAAGRRTDVEVVRQLLINEHSVYVFSRAPAATVHTTESSRDLCRPSID
jgi:hypothetical protein